MQDVVYEDGAQQGDSQPERWVRITDRFLEQAREDDFVGVQTYTRTAITPNRARDRALASPGRAAETAETTQMGYAYCPEALGSTIRRAWRVAGGTPIIVTENGIATSDDRRRIAFVRSALNEVLDCLDEGIDVHGYIYWSLLDNFEWTYGYDMTFGLVAVDRQTFARQPKPSAAWLGQVAKSRRVPVT